MSRCFSMREFCELFFSVHGLPLLRIITKVHEGLIREFSSVLPPICESNFIVGNAPRSRVASGCRSHYVQKSNTGCSRPHSCRTRRGTGAVRGCAPAPTGKVAARGAPPRFVARRRSRCRPCRRRCTPRWTGRRARPFRRAAAYRRRFATRRISAARAYRAEVATARPRCRARTLRHTKLFFSPVSPRWRSFAVPVMRMSLVCVTQLAKSRRERTPLEWCASSSATIVPRPRSHFRRI